MLPPLVLRGMQASCKPLQTLSPLRDQLLLTGVQIETILPGESSAGSTLHVYRVYSTRVPAGPIRLGPSQQGELPYIVLLKGRDPQRRTSSPPQRFSGRHRSGIRGGLRGRLVRSNRRVHGPTRAGAGSSSVGGGLALVAAGGDELDADGELSWLIEPRYPLGEARRGLVSIAKEVDKQAGNAARAALKVAALSTLSGRAEDKAGLQGGGADGTKQPRLRYTVSVGGT